MTQPSPTQQGTEQAAGKTAIRLFQVNVFPEEVYQAPQSWAERAYSKLIHYNQLDKGGHFAAWEQPQLLVEELRAAFRRLPH